MKPAKVEWEHTVIAPLHEYAGLTVEQLNKLGKDGWQLVAVIQISPEQPIQFWLKRAKVDFDV